MDQTILQVVKLLRLPENEEGEKLVNDLLAVDYLADLTFREKLFVILYTNPCSKIANQRLKCGRAAGYSKNMGDYILHNNPKVIAAVEKSRGEHQINKLEEVIDRIVETEAKIYFADRSKLYEDVIYYDDNGDPHKYAERKSFENLSPEQKLLVSNIVKDQRGHEVYETEKRSEARKFLLDYYKTVKPKEPENNSGTETQVILENIKDKVDAKITIIQKNKAESIAAGEYIDKPENLSEEA